jgi:hypothetical protein
MKAIRQATLNWCRFLQTGKRVLLMAAISSILAVGGLGTTGIVHAAGTATLSVSPAALTKNVGDTVQFDIVANIDGAGDPSNAIQANLDYPAGIFDSGTAACGPAMSVQAQASVSGGVIQLACATLGAPVTGIVTVGTVTLHSIAATAVLTLLTLFQRVVVLAEAEQREVAPRVLPVHQRLQKPASRS